MTWFILFLICVPAAFLAGAYLGKHPDDEAALGKRISDGFARLFNFMGK